MDKLEEFKRRINIIELYKQKPATQQQKDFCRIHKVSKASLHRWLKRYDGTPESLKSRSKIRKEKTYDVETRLAVVKLYKSKTATLEEICVMYGVAQSTIYHWLKKYDGTIKSLQNKE